MLDKLLGRMGRPLAMLLLAIMAGGALAQEAAPQGGRGKGQPQRERAAPEKGGRSEAATPVQPRRLPDDGITQHTLNLPGRTLKFTATAGRIVLEDSSGTPEAEIAYVSYVLDGTEARNRPVTFAINGGPGSASAWLHVGTLGPWRLPMSGEAVSPSAPPVLVDNAETWLDFTDLVMIDPVGTGFSPLLARPAPASAESQPQSGSGEGRKQGGGSSEGSSQRKSHFWSVQGDISSLATFIAKWIDKHNRRESPKVVVGESYAGFRGPKIGTALRQGHGIALNGLFLVSPVLDFGWLGPQRGNPMAWVATLPSMAATHRDAKAGTGGRELTVKDMDDVESYAAGEYLMDLAAGDRNEAAVERRVRRVTELTGLDAKLVKRLRGRVDSGTFLREYARDSGRVGSAYDATVTGIDGGGSSNEDPFTGVLATPLTGAMLKLYRDRLGWPVEGRRYRLINREANGAWDWGGTGPMARQQHEAVSDLRSLLSLDPKFRVHVSHGYSDLVTPYFRTRLILDQIPPAIAENDRMMLRVYGGGHMFYSRDGSRAAFREDARRMIEKVVEGRG